MVSIWAEHELGGCDSDDIEEQGQIQGLAHTGRDVGTPEVSVE